MNIYYSAPRDQDPAQLGNDLDFLQAKYPGARIHHSSVFRLTPILNSDLVVYRPYDGDQAIGAHQAEHLLYARLHGKRIMSLTNSSASNGKGKTSHWLSLHANNSRSLPPFLTIAETRRRDNPETGDA